MPRVTLGGERRLECDVLKFSFPAIRHVEAIYIFGVSHKILAFCPNLPISRYLVALSRQRVKARVARKQKPSKKPSTLEGRVESGTGTHMLQPTHPLSLVWCSTA